MPIPVSRTAQSRQNVLVRDSVRRPRAGPSISPCLGELDRVADQVGDDLPQCGPDRRPARSRHARRDVSDAAPGPWPWARNASGLQQLAQRCRARLKSISSRSSLPASIFEKSRMSLITASSQSAELRTSSRYSRCCGGQLGFQQEFRHADDAVHRRADFVAHVGQKLALGVVGRVGGFFLPAESCRSPATSSRDWASSRTSVAEQPHVAVGMADDDRLIDHVAAGD